MNTSHLFGALCAVLFSFITMSANAQLDFNSSGTARYQGGVDAVDMTSAINPGFNVPITADALSDPANDGFSFARGFAEGQLNALGATLKSLSYASGFDPNFDPPSEVRADSNASGSTIWSTASSTLAINDPITVRFLIPITGTLSAEQYFTSGLGPNDVFAEASAALSVDGIILYSGSGKTYDSTPGGINSVLIDQGDWAGDFTSFFLGGDLGDQDAFAIDTVDVVEFNTTLGQSFNVDFMLMTGAFTIGPFESQSIADFGSTGAFSMTAVDPTTGAPVDVNFTPVTAVPIPAALWLFGSGLLGLVGIARRKKSI